MPANSLLRGVYPPVSGELVRPGEVGAALAARVRPLADVRPQVGHQVGSLAVGLAAGRVGAHVSLGGRQRRGLPLGPVCEEKEQGLIIRENMIKWLFSIHDGEEGITPRVTPSRTQKSAYTQRLLLESKEKIQ